MMGVQVVCLQITGLYKASDGFMFSPVIGIFLEGFFAHSSQGWDEIEIVGVGHPLRFFAVWA